MRQVLIFILFLFFNVIFGQMPYDMANYYVSPRVKKIKIQPYDSLSKVITFNINGHSIYLDYNTYMSSLTNTNLESIINEMKEQIKQKDTICVDKYLSYMEFNSSLCSVAFNLALNKKINITKANSKTLLTKLYIGEYQTKNKTGCIVVGRFIYSDKPRIILFAKLDYLYMRREMEE